VLMEVNQPLAQPVLFQDYNTNDDFSCYAAGSASEELAASIEGSYDITKKRPRGYSSALEDGASEDDGARLAFPRV
jgi:hypothetical protein